MAAQKRPFIVPDLGEFVRNHPREIPLELAQRYGGKQVAWSLSGDEILAVGDSLDELIEELKKRGLEPSQAVFDYIDPPDQVWLGWP
jgi:hypothetical protein